MEVIYVGKDNSKMHEFLKTPRDNFIFLLYDAWDDYDHKTSFPVYCRMNGVNVQLPSIKILFQDEMISHQYLESLLQNGWDGKFPIKGGEYISNPENITFYELIDGHLGTKQALDIAQSLHDASYMSHIIEDEISMRMINSSAFKVSLLRERGAVKSFLDGWRVLGKKSIVIDNINFRFKTVTGDTQQLKLNFNSETPLPHDINILIGPNGVGKSQALIQLVEAWFNESEQATGITGFAEKPNINQLVVVSYSPFELFPLDSSDFDTNAGIKKKDESSYRYFGLRTYEHTINPHSETPKKIVLSRKWPKINAAHSLLSCLDDDRRYGEIKTWAKKIDSLYSVLKKAIDFDYIAVGVNHFDDKETLFQGKYWSGDASSILMNKEAKLHGVPEAYIPITSHRFNEPNTDVLRKYLDVNAGITFIKDGEPLKLSSGQRLFSYIVTNILGAIRRNSLILIDEPELFLHPTLEIAFIEMLKEILSSFGSKALFATHSLVTVRELPKDCVHVFEHINDTLFINHPPFETFGGDIQRISSYVFGDKSVSKPFESWLEKKIKEYGSGDELIKALGKNINEEMMIQINAMQEGKW
ncbi:TPA: ATP-binding protein [Enterobacter mori]